MGESMGHGQEPPGAAVIGYSHPIYKDHQVTHLYLMTIETVNFRTTDKRRALYRGPTVFLPLFRYILFFHRPLYEGPYVAALHPQSVTQCSHLSVPPIRPSLYRRLWGQWAHRTGLPGGLFSQPVTFPE
ncbi:hypothetical protein GDO78_020376 [Eleutherodactylus coqui]|uniref:Uncharacterized protein n=1 Tax=Eleutherodactylus coqui TaxID=57060 RepID=A0A8J6C246_ELECQ|nr:hypothetical protein GDO78_020376 [Eleutherodactylus coqui]